MKTCSACSMPLSKPEDFAGEDINSKFCLYCMNEDGTVKHCQEIFEGGVDYFITTGMDRELAEKVCRKNMQLLPYWKGKEAPCMDGEVVSDEEFAKIFAGAKE